MDKKKEFEKIFPSGVWLVIRNQKKKPLAVKLVIVLQYALWGQNFLP